MLLQLLLAGVLSGVYAVHTRWNALKKRLRKSNKEAGT